jgi:hypothetical protein
VMSASGCYRYIKLQGSPQPIFAHKYFIVCINISGSKG